MCVPPLHSGGGLFLWMCLCTGQLRGSRLSSSAIRFTGVWAVGLLARRRGRLFLRGSPLVGTANRVVRGEAGRLLVVHAGRLTLLLLRVPWVFARLCLGGSTFVLPVVGTTCACCALGGLWSCARRASAFACVQRLAVCWAFPPSLRWGLAASQGVLLGYNCR
mgnify:CR=1 FL=1